MHKEEQVQLQYNICRHWIENAENLPHKDAVVHYVLEEEPVRWCYGSLLTAASEISLLLEESGVRPGDVCAIIIKHNPLFYPVYMAVSLLGAIPAVLAYPNPRLHPEKFTQGLRGMSERSGLDWILTDSFLNEKISSVIDTAGSTIRGVLTVFDALKNKAPEDYSSEFLRENYHSLMPVLSVSHDEPFLLQHSSGTTGLQKPVVLSHRSVAVHIENYSRAIDITAEDKIVSWLPLYHDMGLIAAFQMPLMLGLTTIQIDPFEWVMVPSLLTEAISREKATLCWLPNFSYNMMSDKLRFDEDERPDLSSMRMFINCSEPVRYESHVKFLNRFSEYGVTEKKLSACYAMAEATFAVTQTPPGETARTLKVDREQLKKGKVRIVSASDSDASAVRVCMSSGRVLNGCTVRIIDDAGNTVEDDSAGEILISSSSLFDGYRNYPEKTAEVLHDGWYHSGDLGFLHEGYLYVIGRKKDIIIVAGNNIFPEDVEDMISQVDGIIPGRVVAFGQDDPELGSESLSVIAETTLTDEALKKKLNMEIIRACSAINLSIRNVYLAEPRWLIKSSSGKPSRSANKQRIIENNELRSFN